MGRGAWLIAVVVVMALGGCTGYDAGSGPTAPRYGDPPAGFCGTLDVGSLLTGLGAEPAPERVDEEQTQPTDRTHNCRIVARKRGSVDLFQIWIDIGTFPTDAAAADSFAKIVEPGASPGPARLTDLGVAQAFVHAKDGAVIAWVLDRNLTLQVAARSGAGAAVVPVSVLPEVVDLARQTLTKVRELPLP